MRKLFLLVTLMLTVFLANALPRLSSALSLTVEGRGKMSVVVNGQTQYSSFGQFDFINLQPGIAFVQVFRKGRLISEERIDLRRGYKTIASFRYPFGIRIIDRQRIFGNNNDNDDDDDDCLDNDWDRRGNGGRGGNGGYGNGGYDGFDNRILNNQDFERIKQAISRESFDGDKLSSFKTLIRNRNASSSQVAELLSKFSFESTKLDAAKFGYANVRDKHNYYLEVSRLFSFSSDKQALRDYISQQR
jgi:Domain of unknown function (DUF4476)